MPTAREDPGPRASLRRCQADRAPGRQANAAEALVSRATRCDTVPVEAVLLVVAELLSVPLVVAATLLCILGAALLLLLGHLVLRRRTRTVLRRWWRRIVWTAIGGLGLLVAGLVLIELFLFAPALRIALDQIELRSGVDITFQSASGSLFLGRLVLGDVTVRSNSVRNVDFSLTIRSLELDVDMLHIYRAAMPVELVRAAGVRGELVRRESGGGVPTMHAFDITRLELEDVQIDFQDTIGAPFRSLSLALVRLVIAPLRSEYAMHDVLCASEARGSARGYAFTAGPKGWQTRSVPIGPAAHKLGAAGRWIRGGDIDLTLTCIPDPDPEQIALDLDLRLHDFKIAPPGDSGRHLPASRLAAALAALGPELEVHVGLRLARERFHGATNIGQLGLWEAAIQGWNLELGGRLGLGREELLMLGIGSRLLERVSPGPGVRN
jgi:hypothetical protein